MLIVLLTGRCYGYWEIRAVSGSDEGKEPLGPGRTFWGEVETLGYVDLQNHMNPPACCDQCMTTYPQTEMFNYHYYLHYGPEGQPRKYCQCFESIAGLQPQTIFFVDYPDINGTYAGVCGDIEISVGITVWQQYQTSTNEEVNGTKHDDIEYTDEYTQYVENTDYEPLY